MGTTLLVLICVTLTVMFIFKQDIRSIHCYPSISFGIHSEDISNNRLDAPGISVIYTLIARHAQRCCSVGINNTTVVDRMSELLLNEDNKTDYNILSPRVHTPITAPQFMTNISLDIITNEIIDDEMNKTYVISNNSDLILTNELNKIVANTEAIMNYAQHIFTHWKNNIYNCITLKSHNPHHNMDDECVIICRNSITDDTIVTLISEIIQYQCMHHLLSIIMLMTLVTRPMIILYLFTSATTKLYIGNIKRHCLTITLMPMLYSIAHNIHDNIYNVNMKINLIIQILMPITNCIMAKTLCVLLYKPIWYTIKHILQIPKYNLLKYYGITNFVHDSLFVKNQNNPIDYEINKTNITKSDSRGVILPKIKNFIVKYNFKAIDVLSFLSHPGFTNIDHSYLFCWIILFQI